MKKTYLALVLLFTASSITGLQHPIDTQQERISLSTPYRVLDTPPTGWQEYQQYDHGLFSPLEDLSVLSETEFTHIGHPLFPQHGVRIKKTSLCDDKAKSYSGYIDIGTRHMFFYFFESRDRPEKDDVIFWTTGGPGCSSSFALFMELGPCRISDGKGPQYFPESWNSNANIFFVDQPVGVGYSYTDYGETVATTEDAAKDIAAFVAIFFENFSKFKGRAFHMAGESYGGRYIPLFASAVHDQNAKLVEAGLTPVNLTSATIGNGWTDAMTLVPSYFDFTCTPASVPPIFDIASCVRMKQILPRCKKWMKEACADLYDAVNCNAAYQFCSAELEQPYYALGKNPYDISKNCEGEPGDLCYPVTKHVVAYLNSSNTRHLLGVDRAATTPYTICSTSINLAFKKANDQLVPGTPFHVSALLERGIRVLIYVGSYDWVCNWVGNERWTLELDWSGQEAFNAEKLRVWQTTDGNRAGRVRSAGGLTFATVEGAGHLVPMDKPKQALELINRWISGIKL